MVNEALGLQTSASTWWLFVALLVLWIGSLPLLVRGRAGWTSVVMHLTGLAWLAFGLGILFRFLLLSYDAVTFGDLSNRLIERPAAVVDGALLNAAVYWLGVVAAAALCRWLPVPRLLVSLVAGADAVVASALLPVALIGCTVCLVVSLRESTPAALVTPLTLLGSLWIVPATMVWVRALGGAPTSWIVLAGVLAPGALRVVLSPYREYILMLLLVPLVAALAARRRVRLAVIVPATLALALLSTVVIGTYRQILWSGLTAGQAMEQASFTYWDEQPYYAPWMENLRRFHVLDSLMLTVDLVPEALPYSERNLFVEALTRGLVPRIIDPTKDASDEGQRFQTTIWVFDTNPTADVATAAIAPSMPGSLFEAGGTAYVAIGGLLWGLLLAGLDRVKEEVPPGLAAGLHVLCAVQALAGLERDYAMAYSTLVQMLIVFGVCAVVAARLTDAADPVPVRPFAET